MRYKLTDEQNEILSEANELLSKNFDCDYDQYLSYFEIDEHDIQMENPVCTNDECVKLALADLADLQKKGELDADIQEGIITSGVTSNSFDHENIEKCWYCEKPLNGFLTYINYEFEYFRNECGVEPNKDNLNKVKELLKSDYFYLFAIFQSMPSCDFDRNEDYQKEKELYEEVVKWAECVILIYGN